MLQHFRYLLLLENIENIVKTILQKKKYIILLPPTKSDDSVVYLAIYNTQIQQQDMSLFGL